MATPPDDDKHMPPRKPPPPADNDTTGDTMSESGAGYGNNPVDDEVGTPGEPSQR